MEPSVGGFEGAIGGMPLSDVVQLKAYNRFTGSITVENGEQTGTIYFRNGEIIHAEVGDLLGDHAFYLMISWPAGKFSMRTNDQAPARTIENSVSYLLLEAHRLMDEGATPVASSVAATASSRKMTVVERIASLAGVENALLLGESGEILAKAGGDPDSVRPRAWSVTQTAHRLADLFGTGTFLSGVFQTSDESLILFESRHNVLAVQIAADASPAQVETDIRAQLSRKQVV